MERHLLLLRKAALCLAVVMTLLLAWRLISDKNSRVSVESLFVPVSLMGEYSVDGSPWLQLCSDADFGIKAGTTFFFRGNFSCEVEKNMLIMLRITDLYVEISQNGHRIYSFGEKRHPLFKSPGNLWHAFFSPGISPRDHIDIELRPVYGDDYLPAVSRFLNSIHYGSTDGLWRTEMHEYGLSFLIGVVTLVMGLLELAAAAGLVLLKQPLASRCLYGGGFSVSCGLWFAIQYGFISLIVPYPALIGSIDVLSFYFIGLFFILYIGTFLTGARKSVAACSSSFILTLIIGILVLALSGVRDAYDEPDLLVVTVVCGMLAALAAMWREYLFTCNRGLRTVFYTTLPVGIGIMADMFLFLRDGSENTIWLNAGVFVYAVVQWSFTIWQFKVNTDASVREEHMRGELAQSRIAIMLSQIQPHFLFNALATIKSLCVKNPKAARDAIDAFAKYLRGNMDSLNKNRLIPLESELLHLEHYLYIEKLRFGDRVNVEYNLKCRSFMLPALTIQPMVENAVKHGISLKPGGGTISVSTFEERAGFVVEVADDGIGFAPEMFKEGGRSHIGIENTKSRLKFMCGGSLAITSAPGAGTKAVIYIPKEVKG